MMTLVSGGSKCGKSGYAEKLSEKFTGKKIYIATMQPYGQEAEQAIARHREMRKNKNFLTLEQYTDIEKAEIPENSFVLIECMGNLCANEIFSSGIENPTEKIISGIQEIKKRSEELVIVTNSVSRDGTEYTSETMNYIRRMGEINRKLAEISDNVIECVCGIPVALKGKIYV